MHIHITEKNVAGEAFIYGEMEFNLPDLYIGHEDENGVEANEPRVYLTEKDIVDRLAQGSEYHLYLLASVVNSKCHDERDDEIVKLYTAAFMKTDEGGNMDTSMRAFEMVIRLVLGNDIRHW